MPISITGTGHYDFFLTCEALQVGSFPAYGNIQAGPYYANAQGVITQVNGQP